MQGLEARGFLGLSVAEHARVRDIKFRFWMPLLSILQELVISNRPRLPETDAQGDFPHGRRLQAWIESC